MNRWLVLTACSIPFLAGCASSVTPGLANAPRLGGTGMADERVGDVIANGNDACDAEARGGPLRAQLPACPTVEVPAAAAFKVTTHPSGPGLVVRWVQHFYARWPCDVGTPAAGDIRTATWSPSAPAALLACAQ